MAIYRLKRKTFTDDPFANLSDSAAKARKTRLQGRSQVGVLGGLKNTWNRSGFMGKTGMVAATTAATALMAKGLFGGKKKDSNAY